MYPFKKIKGMCLIILLFGLVLLIWPAGCDKKEQPEAESVTITGQAGAETEEKAVAESTALQQPDTEQQEQKVDEKAANASAETVSAEKDSSSGLSMDELLEDMFHYKQLAKNWYGHKAPDFTLTDITGKEHKLSDYSGKDVIVLSWAVWCPGSKSQVALLNEIRGQIGEDKLAILAVCHKTGKETIETVREYAAKHPIGFPVFYVDLDSVPSPFDMNLFVPASYFIDSRGNLKLAVEDILSIEYIHKVLEARR